MKSSSILRRLWSPGRALALSLVLGALGFASGRGEESSPPPPPEAGKSGPGRPSIVVPARSEHLIRDRNIFGILKKYTPPPPPPPSSVKKPPPPPAKANKSEPEVKVPFTLLGTMVFGEADSRQSLAILQAKKGNLQGPVGLTELFPSVEGDGDLEPSKVDQIRVLNIERNKIVVWYKGAERTLEVDWKGEPSGPTRLASRAVPARPPPPVVVNPFSTRVPPRTNPQSTETREVSRSLVDRNLQNLTGLLQQMRIQPYFQNGRPSGFLLTNIRKGGFIDQVGVKSGDVLRFVNGTRIDNVQNAFQLYNIFKNSSNVEVVVIRNSRPVTLKYSIR